MAAVTICSDFGAPQNKVSHWFCCISTYSHEVMGSDAMILTFWMLSFKPAFSLSTFTFIKRLFSSSSLSAIRVVSSAYLRLLIFLPAVLIPACASSSLAFYNYCKTVIGLKPGWEVTMIVLRICSPFKYCMEHITGKPPLLVLFASIVHFILQPLKLHGRQIDRKLKTKKNKERKIKTLNIFNM